MSKHVFNLVETLGLHSTHLPASGFCPTSQICHWAITTIFKTPAPLHLSPGTLLSLWPFTSHSRPYFPVTYQHLAFQFSSQSSWVSHRLLKLHMFIMDLVTFPLTLLLLMYFLARCHHYPPSYLTQEIGSFPTFFPLQNNQNRYISLSFQFIIFSPSPMNSLPSKPSWPLLRLLWSPIRLFHLAPLPLVHTTAARGIFLLTPVIMCIPSLWFPPPVALPACFIPLWCDFARDFNFVKEFLFHLLLYCELYLHVSAKSSFSKWYHFLPFPQRMSTQPCGLTVPSRCFSKGALTG